MHETLEEEVRRIVANMENEQNEQRQETPEPTEQEQQPIETIHIHYFPDAIVILKEDAETAQVVESAPVIPRNISFIPAYAICSFYLFLILSCLAFQAYEILNPGVAIVTIFPKAQTATLTGTLQLGRILSPLTISQSKTVSTTGKGHQPAEQARGFITFYNGQFQSVTIAAGTILTASNGAQVITKQDAYIPAESQSIPPTLGHTTVSAHALISGTRGNILIGAINQGCCAPSVLAQNTSSFTGGQDERNFQTVSKADIASISTPLKTTVTQSMSGALQGQVKEGEQLFILSCTPSVMSDYSIGTEATQVKVTVSETCSTVAYNSQELETKAAALLSIQALKKLGSGYSLFGTIHVSVTQATIQKQVIVSYDTQGIWVYAISQQAQQSIKQIIAGKPRDEAIKVLLSLPGIERASIEGEDNSRLPKNITSIHFQIIIQSS